MSRMVLLLNLLLATQARAQEPASGAWPLSLTEAIDSQGKLMYADTMTAVPLLGGAAVVRAVIFRCFDCAPGHAAWFKRGALSVVITQAPEFSRVWPWISQARSPSGSLREAITDLVDIACVPGCRPRLLLSVDSIEANARIFFWPQDSLAVIRPPQEERSSEGEHTVFFLSTTSGIYRFTATLSATQEVVVKTEFVAGAGG
jgi:hypothetical protein